MILDIVPNHMAVDDANRYWADPELRREVLRHRPGDRRATGASSTSTTSRACGRRTPRSSRRRTGSRWRSCARGSSTGCGSTTPTGWPTRPATCGALHRRGRRARLGREDPRPRRAAARLAGRGDGRLRVPQRRAGAVRRPGGGGGALVARPARRSASSPSRRSSSRRRRRSRREVDRLDRIHEVRRRRAAARRRCPSTAPTTAGASDEDREALRARRPARPLRRQAGRSGSRASSRRRRRSWPRASRTPRSTATSACSRSTTSAATRRGSASPSSSSTRRTSSGSERFPRNLLVTQTHDTKRSGDVRARIGALAGLADEYVALAREWLRPRPDGPDELEQLFVFQTMLGAHPIAEDRVRGYFEKALREAKRNSNWIEPDEDYERRVADFALEVPSFPGFAEFAEKVAEAGPPQRAGPDAAEAHRARRARHLPGRRARGALARRPRQPPRRSTGRSGGRCSRRRARRRRATARSSTSSSTPCACAPSGRRRSRAPTSRSRPGRTSARTSAAATVLVVAVLREAGQDATIEGVGSVRSRHRWPLVRARRPIASAPPWGPVCSSSPGSTRRSSRAAWRAHVRKLTEQLAAAGHDVHVLTRGGDHAPAEEERHGVTVHRVREPAFPRDDLDAFLAWVAQMNADMLAAGAELLERFDFDLLHSHDWLVAVAAQRLAARMAVPWVVTVHATEHGRHQGWVDKHPQSLHPRRREADGPPRRPRHRLLEVHARPHRRGLRPAAGRRHRDPERHRPDRPARPRGPRRAARAGTRSRDEKLVLLAGRLVYEKGFQVALDALPQRDRARRRTCASSSPGTGTHEDELRKQATRLGLDRYGTFAGWLGDDALHGLYRIADLCVIPSLYEPFGLVALEAMAQRLPVRRRRHRRPARGRPPRRRPALPLATTPRRSAARSSACSPTRACATGSSPRAASTCCASTGPTSPARPRRSTGAPGPAAGVTPRPDLQPWGHGGTCRGALQDPGARRGPRRRGPAPPARPDHVPAGLGPRAHRRLRGPVVRPPARRASRCSARTSRRSTTRSRRRAPCARTSSCSLRRRRSTYLDAVRERTLDVLDGRARTTSTSSSLRHELQHTETMRQALFLGGLPGGRADDMPSFPAEPEWLELRRGRVRHGRRRRRLRLRQRAPAPRARDRRLPHHPHAGHQRDAG